jgi:uncharacterized membrane protein YpjA
MSEEDQTDVSSVRFVSARIARAYLESAELLLFVILANVLTLLVGVDFYVATMPKVSPLLWPFYTDSPAALFLMILSLVTLLPSVGQPLSTVPQNRILAYLHTFAFVWLVKYGSWAIVAIALHPGAYADSWWRFGSTLFVHLLFVFEAYFLPLYGRTTRGALGAALAVSLFDVLLDYGIGLHPPLRYEVGIVLPILTVGLSILSVIAATFAFDRLESPG